MSLKINFLDPHLDCFPDNLGTVVDEQGEHFFKEISTVEMLYQQQWNDDYCWTLKRNVVDTKYRMKQQLSHFRLRKINVICGC